MAIIPKNEYPGQTIGTDPNYPHGKARNITGPGDGNGTPWEQRIVNDIWGFQQALLARGGVTPSGVADNVAASDYVDALDAAYDQTLQDAFDRSVAAGDDPGILVPANGTLAIASAGAAPADPRATMTFGGLYRVLELAPATAKTVVAHLKNKALLAFGTGTLGADGAFLVGAPDAMAGHGITTPAAPNEMSRAALVRAPGIGTKATEWMPMDWGDSDGGGSGWTMNAAGVTDATAHGRWSQTGNIVTFSMRGTAELGGGDVTVALPVPSDFVYNRDVTGASSVLTLGGGGIPGSTFELSGYIEADITANKIKVRMENAGATADVAWFASGQYTVK